MAEFKVGQKVSADMSGFQATGVQVPQGVHLSGNVDSVVSAQITIKLIEPFMGRNTVTVEADRVKAK